MSNPLTDHTARLEEQAEQTRLYNVDAANAVARPSTVGEFYVEREYKQTADGQTAAWSAQSQTASRDAASTKAATRLGSKTAAAHTKGHEKVVETARDLYVDAKNALAPFVRRGPDAKRGYVLRTCGLLLGDIAGQFGAALNFGEDYATAGAQAVATGVAVITAGLIGGEIRSWRDRHTRQATEASKDAGRWAHLFTPDPGERIGRLIVYAGLTCGVLISCAVATLRHAVDADSGAAWIFGPLSGALVLASAINTYMHADEISTLLERLEADYHKELRQAQVLAATPAHVAYQQARVEAASIRREHKARGRHAAAHVNSLKNRVLGNNPGVAGHGPAPTPPTGTGLRLVGGHGDEGRGDGGDAA